MDVLSLLVALLALASAAFAAPQDPAKQTRTLTTRADPASLNPLFIVKQGAQGVSGCDYSNRLANIKTSYTEAIAMVQKALVAITNVETGDKEDGEALWDRQFMYLFNLFSVRMGDDGFAEDPGPNDLRNGDAQYDLMKRRFNAILKDVYTANPTIHGYVACTDAGINFVGPDEKIEPDDENTLNHDGRFPYGAWCLAGDDADFPEIVFGADVDDNKNVIPKSRIFCGAGGRAFTMYAAVPVIVFCDPGFALPVTAANGNIQSGVSLTQYQSLSKVWVHELCHAWTSGVIDDQVAVDSTKLVVPQKVNGQWKISPKVTNDRVAYGVVQAMLIAENYPPEAIINADNYAFFALANWYDNWSWVYGAAEPI